MISIDVTTRKLRLSKREQFLASGAATRKALVPEFNSVLANKLANEITTSLNVSLPTMKFMIRKYSEQLIYQPLKEIQFWFSYKSGAFIEPGYPPLYYSRKKGKKVSPNKSAVAGIGEGVAGLIGQRLYRARKLARPNHDYPDIVMKSQSRLFLIESKATLAENYGSVIDVIYNEIPRMVSYTTSCMRIDRREIIGVLTGTNIGTESRIQAYVLEIELS